MRCQYFGNGLMPLVPADIKTWPIGVLTPGLNLNLAPSNCCLIPQWLAEFAGKRREKWVPRGIKTLVRRQYCNISCNKALQHILPESRLAPAARRLRESACGAQLSHVTQRRDRARVYLYILCSWVYQHVSLCPKLNRIWLTGERARSCHNRGGSRDCSPSFVMQQHKHAVLWTVGGAACMNQFPHSLVISMCDCKKNKKTNALIRNEFWYSGNLVVLLYRAPVLHLQPVSSHLVKWDNCEVVNVSLSVKRKLHVKQHTTAATVWFWIIQSEETETARSVDTSGGKVDRKQPKLCCFIGIRDSCFNIHSSLHQCWDIKIFLAFFCVLINILEGAHLMVQQRPISDTLYAINYLIMESS